MIPALPSPSSAAIDWYSFLKRPRLASTAEESLVDLRGTSILVTGAGGSIGSALSMKLANLQPRKLALLDLSEQALYRLQSTMKDAALPMQPQLVLANIADLAHLEDIFEAHRPQLVFHAAAYKHVPLLEEHPLEALANNALGTLRLAECASRFHAQIVLLSTDKAVDPISILGASKRIAELIVLAHRGVVLRLGNVLGTEGSVSETLLHQIAAGRPLTITDPNAERYFLTGEEAVDLLLASAMAASGSLLVPDLDRQYKVASLAEFLLSMHASEAQLSTVYTGLRPGDKVCEALWSADEQPVIKSAFEYLEIRHKSRDQSLLHRTMRTLEDALRQRDLVCAIEAVLELIPSYQPSATIRALMQPTVPQIESGGLPR